jgi:hypothetical protein
MIQILNQLWQREKRSLRLQRGISELAIVLQPISEENNFIQQIVDNEIQWSKKDGKVDIIFFYIPDPRDLEMVCTAFKRTRDTRCDFSCIFVHQWTDGEGNWDVFGLHPQRGLVHWNRFWGNRWLVNDTGPFLKTDFYTLFSCSKEFPKLSRKKWANLLIESEGKIKDQLGLLAENYGCLQEQIDNMVRWRNSSGQIEVLFSIYQNFPSLDDYIRHYDQIKIEKYPVTFFFQKAQSEIFDIFRFSSRSYIEHHNQIK